MMKLRKLLNGYLSPSCVQWGKKPVSIFTDQDAAMAKAISIVMPDVTHGLCTFHLNQNALKHLGHLFRDDSDFGKELNTCIFGYEDEQKLEQGLDRMSVMEISESYILCQWRLDAKACASKDNKVSVEEDDPKLAKAVRYRNLCPKMVKLCARSCELKATYEFIATGVEDMCAKMDKMLLEVGDSIDEGIEQLEVIDPRFRGVNGLKKKARVNKPKGKRETLDVPMPYVPEMINCESNLSSQTSFHPQTFEVCDGR
ncbi:hypothetical protein RHGRI_014013 [Rhododendron griersonianum]|uniref:Protein FAR1-RELATED SEQUENCE n=1 Tax=Rhododendron griersonianum TaxID=479676 RepID=A0AAV6K8B6_9ERIC|nr:hypothetical protein RHGRI_014013 [Rhododendron griersonianum]